MNILAIETSCDETAASILSGDPKNPDKTLNLLSNVIVSQVDIFKAYGGVIPEVAARSHLEAILPVVHKAFSDADLMTPDKKDDWSKIDAIAVTHTPGLLGSLLIGTLTARTLAILHNKPLYPVHHLKSHIYANWLKRPETLPSFPLLSFVISGGHTQIIYIKKHNNFKIIGTTLDDAIGECFDKVAKVLGLPYPGGPAISKAALGIIEDLKNYAENPAFKDLKVPLKIRKGNPEAYPLPHPKIKGLDFSFSGLKTAVLRSVQKACNLEINHPSFDLKNHLTPEQIVDFAASFEKTAVDILLEKLNLALKEYPETASVVFAGGVSANDFLRKSIKAYFPEKSLSGDNAAMVAAAALYEISSGITPTDPYSLDIAPRSPISSSRVTL